MRDQAILAFDLGGTDLKVARIAGNGDVHGFTKLPSNASQGEAALFEAITLAAGRVGDGVGPAIAGFGTPGVLHPESGVIVDRTPNLRLPADFPMRSRLEQLLGRRVVIDNDANCAALAEHLAGAARGARVSLTVTVGTGVGCGIVSEGRVLRGAFGGAGEIGHMPLGSTGPPCGCGVVGCAEPMASGSGLVARAREAGLAVASAREVFESDDPRAAAVIERMVDHLARMLGAATALLNPDVIVVGGGVAQAGERLLEPLRERCWRYMLGSHRRTLRIVPAMLGEQAGVIGAGLAAWQANGNGNGNGGGL
jgi:glucokinase